jgi:hypothetical protein
LHRFVDPVDGATYLYTHFEPTDARRVFANFEQPDLKARFTFVVTAPRAWLVVSGQPEATRTDGGGPVGELVTVSFAPTPPQSGYLTALAAGPYHRVADVWRRNGGSHDRAFGFPYPWGKYDSIYVPEYNIGAMENPGLVTFSEGFLHRGAATRADRARRAEVILHEMAHMWFGDLVTPRCGIFGKGEPPNKYDTWLKESFADLMATTSRTRPRSSTLRGPRSPCGARRGPTSRTSCPRRRRGAGGAGAGQRRRPHLRQDAPRPGSLAVREHLATVPTPLSRALVWSALWNATRDAELSAMDYLDIASRHGHDPGPRPVPRCGAGPGARPEDHPVVRQARAWLQAHQDAPAALRRIVVEQLDDLERAAGPGLRPGKPAAVAPQEESGSTTRRRTILISTVL